MKSKWMFAVAALLVSGIILIGSKAEANPNLFLGQFPMANIEVNGEVVPEEDVPAFIVNGRTVLPFRQMAEMLNSYVDWDGSRMTVIVKKPIVNMAIIQERRSSIDVNPSFKTGTHSFNVAAQISRVPKSKKLNLRFTVINSSDRRIFTGLPYPVDTSQLDGSFQGNLNVSNLRLNTAGEYILNLEMEDPNQRNRYITIGEYVIVVE